MHYESIAQAAVHLGFLRTDSQTPEIIMSTVLSRAAASPNSPISRVKPGVFSLHETTPFFWDFGKPNSLSPRVQRLAAQLSLPEISVTKRALFVLRRCHECAAPSTQFSIGNGRVEFTLDFGNPDTLEVLRDNLVRSPSLAAGRTLEVNRAIWFAASKLCQSLDMEGVDLTFEFAVGVLEIAAAIHSEGRVIVEGSQDVALLRVCTRSVPVPSQGP